MSAVLQSVSARATPVTSTAPSTLMNWPRAALDLLREHEAVVRVVIARVRGSAPREAGASMLVTHDRIVGTIGGGSLEWQAMADARALLDSPRTDGKLTRHLLGRELGQCCGGVVELWSERYTRADRTFLDDAVRQLRAAEAAVLESRLDAGRIARRWHADPSATRPRLIAHDGGADCTFIERLSPALAPLWLFGAGHVGQALVPIMAALPFRITWIDSRPGLFPAALAESVGTVVAAQPAACVASAPPGCRYLVMSHDHRIDYALCQAILARGDAAFVGVIGSASKAARFRSRLLKDGLSRERLAPLVCPVGIAGIASKLPAAIAVGVAAQLLQGLDVKAAGIVHDRALDDCRIDLAHGCASCGLSRVETSSLP